MVCYRKHGHNEGDDPKFTQPQMYEIINNHPDPREMYVKKLMAENEVNKNMAEEMEASFWEDLQQRLDLVKQSNLPYEYQEPEQQWRSLKKKVDAEDFLISPETGIEKERVEYILKSLMSTPKGFTLLSKIKRLQKGKQKLLDENKLDWALAELLAYGSILMEGKNVRMSGQDVRRGTFSHRHAVFYDAKTFEEYNRLSRLSEDQGRFMIYNSLLSEFAVLGFEYGYSLASPNELVLWEAQFGDFANGAQTIFDQFITAGESKWQRMSGITLLLPHGYEGQGPEHSSARLERYLQACAEWNLTVANITTPANFFHALRRQLERPFRKPLIVMSPKSLLRHPECVSDIDDFVGDSRFQELIVDHEPAAKVKRVLLCSGKIYYQLRERKVNDKRNDVVLARLEQLYPLPDEQIMELFDKYNNAQFFWVQEEPMNMGAWWYMLNRLRETNIDVISRKRSASPATGFKKIHDKEQDDIIDRAFAE
jgi:2-oxoglutarate dehydrogenase E1 component